MLKILSIEHFKEDLTAV